MRRNGIALSAPPRRAGPSLVAAAGLSAAGVAIALAAGLVAAAITQALLALAGAAQIVGPPVGLLAAPLLLAALLRPGLRRQLVSGPGLLLVGAAWTLAPIVDHHLTAMVLVDGGLPDAVHHGAGWLALAAGWVRIERGSDR
ncbi:hypothetical protein [Patulibacter defluvii]|uniref:hypothetical protein n=1 Tax=Patulibacter defluvii TaxID=3095358 RepID=UPI002A758EB1|nr:hypothetical protein [Patulibacter sp. DM4]